MHCPLGSTAAIEQQQVARILIQIPLAGQEHRNGVFGALILCVQLLELLLDLFVCLLGVGEHDFNDLGRFVDFGLHNYPSYRCIVPNSIQFYTASLL